jgi:hypothetical protein
MPSHPRMPRMPGDVAVWMGLAWALAPAWRPPLPLVPRLFTVPRPLQPPRCRTGQFAEVGALGAIACQDGSRAGMSTAGSAAVCVDSHFMA